MLFILKKYIYYTIWNENQKSVSSESIEELQSKYLSLERDERFDLTQKVKIRLNIKLKINMNTTLDLLLNEFI